MQPPPYESSGPGSPPAATPVPPMVAAVVSQDEVGIEPRQRRIMIVLSRLQAAIGISCAIIYTVLIFSNRTLNNFYNGGYLDVVGAGIWCGGVYIVAGGLGVAAARRNSRCLIISSMVFSILSSLMIWVVIGFAAAAIDTTTRDERRQCYFGGEGYYNQHPSYYNCYVYNFSGYKAVDSILIVISCVELVISIWCSVLCCKGVCKSFCRGWCYNQTETIYTPVHFHGQRVMFIQRGGVADGQVINVLPTQPFFVDMQQHAHVGHPIEAPPAYEPAVAVLPA